MFDPNVLPSLGRDTAKPSLCPIHARLTPIQSDRRALPLVTALKPQDSSVHLKWFRAGSSAAGGTATLADSVGGAPTLGV